MPKHIEPKTSGIGTYTMTCSVASRGGIEQLEFVITTDADMNEHKARNIMSVLYPNASLQAASFKRID